jgi:hypothetical protein
MSWSRSHQASERVLPRDTTLQHRLRRQLELAPFGGSPAVCVEGSEVGHWSPLGWSNISSYMHELFPSRTTASRRWGMLVRQVFASPSRRCILVLLVRPVTR